MPAPTSTYRLQLNASLRLDDAADLTDYLAALGAGALYSSPLLTAMPGSTHGYDLADPTRTSPALGGEDARRQLAQRLRQAGLGFVVDVVCNHMGVDDPAANPWWWEVLRDGPASRYASYFDIDWSAGPLLLPVLGDDGDGGAAAEKQLELADGMLRYYERRYPLADGTGHGTPSEVHRRQHYRLVSWRRGAAESNYRRFFNIDSLAGLRTEDPEVRSALHAETLRWVRAGEVTGLRIDHPDGLADPGDYLRALRALAPDCWIVVEKVLAAGEPLPASWPVDGTTGYEALHEIGGVFVDPVGRTGLDAASGNEGTAAPGFEEAVAESRRQVVGTLFAAEVRRIAACVHRLLPQLPSALCRKATEELLIGFPVYRSYLPEHRWALDRAVVRAQAAHPGTAQAVAAIRDAMLADPRGELATRVQQSTGAVMAKGAEDTALYRCNRLTALNDVGGDPDRFGVPPDAFHAAAAAREASWPATMTTLSTHDTKRSEDVRARLAVLSELPEEYTAAVRGWSARQPLGDPVLEPLAWQTLIGAWPISPDRMAGYLLKAAREARLRTDWTHPDQDVEDRLRDWVRHVLDDAPLCAELARFTARIEPPGWSNALGQKLLQLAGPGIPDVYQGTELWDYSLVDPDNRRPVDFARRRALLARIDAGELPGLDESGAAKLLLVSRVLRLRRDRPELWTGYLPLRAEGPAAPHLIGFSRGPRRQVVALATRLPLGLARSGGWADTLVPLPGGAGEWTDVLTGLRVAGSTDHPGQHPAPRLAEVFHRYPVALLLREPARPTGPHHAAPTTREARR